MRASALRHAHAHAHAHALVCVLVLAASTAVLVPTLAYGDAASDQLFLTKVWPIINASCISCHGPDKQKGKLRLDSRDAWLAGGRDGKVVTAGAPERSLLVDCIKYKAKKEDQDMPPKRKDQLSAEQVSVISDWIAAGLLWPDPQAAKKK